MLDDDVESARERRRARYARAVPRTAQLHAQPPQLRLQPSEDIADGGSDRLIDAIVPHGSADEIAAAAREHLDAGADHVCLQTVGVGGVPRSEWTALASALGIAN